MCSGRPSNPAPGELLPELAAARQYQRDLDTHERLGNQFSPDPPLRVDAEAHLERSRHGPWAPSRGIVVRG
jgi:hypothetical protein